MLPKLDVPIYELKLISNGKIVKFRPFLVKEQKIFLMASQSEDAKEVIDAIKQVLSNCVVDDTDVTSLPVFDLEFLFLNLRAKSVGENVELNYVCNNLVKNEKDGEEEEACGGKIKLNVNLMEVDTIKNPEHTNKIMLTDKLGLMMKYPSFDIIKKLNIQNESELLKVIISCIDYIFDENEIYYAKDTTEEELTDFIESMQQSDVQKIQKFFETMPKISKNVEFKCKKCGYEEKTTIEGIQNFFG
jgi:hypothetical protein